MDRQPSQHFTLLPVTSQPIHVAFDGGRIVSDAGVLRALAEGAPEARRTEEVTAALRRLSR